MSTVAGAAQDPESEYGQDQVKVFSHEGDGETHEHLNSMDLNDVKNELEKDAESAEVSDVYVYARGGVRVRRCSQMCFARRDARRLGWVGGG